MSDLDTLDWLNDDSALNGADSLGWLDDNEGDDIETPFTFNHPLATTRTVKQRETIRAQKGANLAQVITALPDANTDLYIIASADGKEHSRTGHLTHGSFDYGDFVPVCLDMLLKDTGCTGGAVLYVSTWIFNSDFVKAMRTELESGRLASLHMLGDKFQRRRHNSPTFNQMLSLIQAHPPSRIRLSPNHVKALCMTVGGRYCTITGSSNLSAVARHEQAVLTTSPQIYRFFIDEFFEPIFAAKGK